MVIGSVVMGVQMSSNSAGEESAQSFKHADVGFFTFDYIRVYLRHSQ
jgi:hypothetical protein